MSGRNAEREQSRVALDISRAAPPSDAALGFWAPTSQVGPLPLRSTPPRDARRLADALLRR